jgi:hypothetical protein
VVRTNGSTLSARDLASRLRSPELEPGQFRRLGNLHLHLDGGRNIEMVASQLSSLKKRGALGKINPIEAFVAGPQRRDLPEVYASHTPGSSDREDFEYFATTTLKDRADAVDTLRWLVPRVAKEPGLVLEVERVVAHIEGDQDWTSVPFDDVEPIAASEVGIESAATEAFELHLAFEFEQFDAALDLGDLVEASGRCGVYVGGWYRFIKDNRWSYRSNSFTGLVGLKEYACRQHQGLKEYLDRLGWHYRQWTTVEQVIAIYHT